MNASAQRALLEELRVAREEEERERPPEDGVDHEEDVRAAPLRFLMTPVPDDRARAT